MKWVLVLMTMSFHGVPTTALASKGPCTDDRLRFCSVTADPGAA